MSCLMTAGCVQAQVVPAERTSPATSGRAVDVEPVRTSRGSTISFLRVDAPDEDEEGQQVVEAQVEACVPATATEDGTFSPRYFRLVLESGRALGPDIESVNNRPLVRTATVYRGSCVRGWLPFRMRPGDKPVFLRVEGLRGAGWPFPMP